jgi:hypothetical protein
MNVDPRLLPGCLAGALAAPNVPADDVLAIVTATLTAADALLEQDGTLPADAPAHDWALIDDVVAPQAVWDYDTGEFGIVAANPPVRHDDELLVTFEDGTMRPYARGALVAVAADWRQALAWNRQHANVDVAMDDWADEERGAA